jgi:hypothetical protein
MNLTPKVLKGLRFVAAGAGAPTMEITPEMMLALLDRIEELEVMEGARNEALGFISRIHGMTDAAVMNQAIFRFLHPDPGPSALKDADPDEENG